MVTDLRRRPVMGFLYLGVEAGGVYRWAIGQRLGTPILQQGEADLCWGGNIRSRPGLPPIASKTARLGEEQLYLLSLIMHR